MKRLLTAVVGLVLGLSAASAQSVFTMPPPAGVMVGGFQVVATCGAATLAPNALAFGAMDATGKICTSSSGGGGGGTSSTYGAAFPATGTAIGFTDGTNMAAGRVGDVNNVAAATNYIDALSIGRYNATQPTLTDTRFSAFQLSSRGAIIVAPGADNFAIQAADGADVTQGAKADSVCGTATGTCTVVAILKYIANTVGGAIAAGTNYIGQVGLNPVTSGGLSWTTFEPAASDNHTNLKNGAGQVYHISATNNSATINYLRLYNAGTGFNGCNSATNIVYTMAIPASTNGAGYVADIAMGIAFATGISYCVVSAYGQNTTTNATASAMDINIGYK